MTRTPGRAISAELSPGRAAARGVPPPDAQDDSAAEFGILFSHTSEMVWPDLIGRAFPDAGAARANGESITCAQGGIEFAIMSRCASRPQWVEVGGHRADRAPSHRPALVRTDRRPYRRRRAPLIAAESPPRRPAALTTRCGQHLTGPSVGWRSNNPLTSGWAWRTVGIVKVNVVERSRVRVRVATAFVLALALVVAVALPSYAYHLEGPTWGGQPSAGTCCAHITVGIESSDSADTNAWADGISVWNSSAAFLYFDRPGDYKIGLAEINDSGNSSDGYTSYYYVFGNFTSMSAWLNHYWIAGYPSLKSRGVAAHELGHVAGLAHSDGCVVMQAYSVPRESCGISYPVSDDINGVNAMY